MMATSTSTPKLKIISGGQTGVDRLALEVAHELGIPTGGTAARWFKTEAGNDASLRSFGLVPCEVSGYPARTAANVSNSNLTIVYTQDPEGPPSKGSSLTIKLCRQRSKPVFVNASPEMIASRLGAGAPLVINVAGTRGSKLQKTRADEIRAHLVKIMELLR